MVCSSFLKAAAAPHPAPHASPSQQQSDVSRTTWWVNTQVKSRTTWWVNTQVKSRTTWWVNTQEPIEVFLVWPKQVISSFGQDWWQWGRTDVLWLFVSFLRLPFACPGPRCYSSATLIQWICFSNSLCFFRPLFCSCSMYCTQSSTVCTCKTCQQSEPLQLQQIFSRGYDPYTHACKARPLTTVGRTSLSVIIILSYFMRILGAGGEIYNGEDGVPGVDYEEDIGRQRVSSFR